MLRRYERITFDKESITVPGKPVAEFVCPGHPLLDATIDVLLQRHRTLLRDGAILVAEADPRTEPRALVYLEHAIQDGRTTREGQRRVVSKRFEFVEADRAGEVQLAGYAPYLDYRPIAPDELELIQPLLAEAWLSSGLEAKGMDYAIERAVPAHLEEVRARTLGRLKMVEAAVRDRLTKEINYWDHRADQLKDKELAGKGAKGHLNSGIARQRAEELAERLKRRLEEIEQERQISAQQPVIVGGALVVPAGYLASLQAAGARPDRHRHDHQRAHRRRCRDGHRARARPRARGAGPLQPGLRHPLEGPDHWRAALHRGQGPRRRRADGHRDANRDSDGAQQGRGIHPRARACRGWKGRRAFTIWPIRSKASPRPTSTRRA